MPKKVRRRTKRKISKISNGRKIILLSILILGALIVLYPFSKVISKKGTSSKNGEPRIESTLVYPGSSEKLYTETGERITINYKTQVGVESKSVINFYVENLPKLGWMLTSESDIDAVFEKGDKKIRVWVLYADNNLTDGVDYIIDYSPSESEETLQEN